jgi:hypothetical protein
MKLRTEIHPVAEDGSEFLTKAEITQADTAQSAGREFREHIDVTSRRVEIVAQD